LFELQVHGSRFTVAISWKAGKQKMAASLEARKPGRLRSWEAWKLGGDKTQG